MHFLLTLGKIWKSTSAKKMKRSTNKLLSQFFSCLNDYSFKAWESWYTLCKMVWTINTKDE